MTAELTYSKNSTDTWATPQALFGVLHREFDFTIDLAAEASTAKCPRYFTKEQDALKQSWAGEVGFCNPPYGRGVIDKFVERAHFWANHGVTTTVMLVPSSTDSMWWWNFARHAEVRFIAKGRLTFGTYIEKKTGKKRNGGAPFRSAVLIFRAGLPTPPTDKLFWDWKA